MIGEEHPELVTTKLESIQTQQVSLHAMGDRHLLWRTNTDDPELKCIHLEIADLIHKTARQYDLLLAIYQHRA
jgi:hypothetical protein